MDPKFEQPYSPQNTEKRIYTLWEESGLFNPDTLVKEGHIAPDATPFTIVLPPPNVTGTLHTGHSMMLAVEDIMVRYKRMRGYKTLWLPGTDHAAIATQSKVEKNIQKEEKKSRHDLGREAFLKRVEAFAQESHDTITSQMRSMGSSVDWSREAFTLDDARNHAVNTAFKKMYDDGIIYRGERIVNWDPKGQTTISDDEIVYEDRTTPFYYFTYGPFTIGTSRPETKFGDKHVVVHPDDPRYKEFKHGDTFTVEWINGPIEATVIKDEVIDMELGTGAMTITPWHSMVDFELAEKHNIKKEQVIDLYGKMLPIAGEFAGMKIAEAREKIVEKMKAKGLVVKVDENYQNRVATAERTGGIIEPQIMRQWFVNVNKAFTLKHSTLTDIPSGSQTTLKEIMSKAVSTKQVSIIPDRFEKVYFSWIDNLRDWCISRQIWYGHRIPVWYKNDEIYCGVTPPDGEGWEQDPDTLDTWFSSGLWTFSTLGWPENTEDLKTYHPTDVLETGYDILFFWIARMILMSGYLIGDIPFKTVYLHGLVRDEKGRKMSKSLGNIVDPVEKINEYGADALRMALVVANPPGADSNISDNKIKAYKHFANKLWNITRFVEMNTGSLENGAQPNLSDRDTEILKELSEIKTRVTSLMDEYKFYLASEELYQYVWHTIADTIIEEMKPRLQEGSNDDAARHILRTLLREVLIMLHPFMPFITEEIWQTLTHTEGMLMVTPWNNS